MGANKDSFAWSRAFVELLSYDFSEEVRDMEKATKIIEKHCIFKGDKMSGIEEAQKRLEAAKREVELAQEALKQEIANPWEPDYGFFSVLSNGTPFSVYMNIKLYPEDTVNWLTFASDSDAKNYYEKWKAFSMCYHAHKEIVGVWDLQCGVYPQDSHYAFYDNDSKVWGFSKRYNLSEAIFYFPSEATAAIFIERVGEHYKTLLK